MPFCHGYVVADGGTDYDDVNTIPPSYRKKYVPVNCWLYACDGVSLRYAYNRIYCIMYDAANSKASANSAISSYLNIFVPGFLSPAPPRKH